MTFPDTDVFPIVPLLLYACHQIFLFAITFCVNIWHMYDEKAKEIVKHSLSSLWNLFNEKKTVNHLPLKLPLLFTRLSIQLMRECYAKLFRVTLNLIYRKPPKK